MKPQDPIQKLIPGSCYHIYNRGNNKEIIFKSHENYIYFLTQWKKYIQPIADTFCYNLLPNHFHFFIRIKEVNKNAEPIISKPVEQSFSNLFNSYAKSLNKRYNRTGSLFQERFKRKEVLNDYYFSEIVGYILTNAKKHGYSKNILEYPYSVYKSLISTSNTLLLRDEVISFFGGRIQFMKFIENYSENILLKKFFFENEMDDE
ncbi:MAG: hypothetical protein ABIR31_01220 [Ginsengibacter sp.]